MIDPKVNRLLVIKIRTAIIAPLNDLVEWDRYGIRNADDSGFLFGWIKRDDGLYDFVSISFRLERNLFTFNYSTSSKEYSEEIARRLTAGTKSRVEETYLECEPMSDFPEANLVSWQRAKRPTTTNK